nr:30S ribosomal protein S10 [Mesomycoplasma hyorhinis]
MFMDKIQIKLKAFDHRLIDNATAKIVLVAKEANAEVSGPIPLPTKKEIFTILRSVHVNKKSREQFESRTHQRLIIVKTNSSNSKVLVDKIKRLQLNSGVKVSLELS